MRGRNTRRHQRTQRGGEVCGARPQGGSPPPVRVAEPTAGQAHCRHTHSSPRRKEVGVGVKGAGEEGVFFSFLSFSLVAKREGWLKKQAPRTDTWGTLQNAPHTESFSCSPFPDETKSNWRLLRGGRGTGNPDDAIRIHGEGPHRRK